MLVRDMLVIAASALTEIRADGVNSLGRANDDLSELRPIETFPALNHFNFDPFPVDRERYEYDFSVKPADTGSAECDVMNVQFDRGT
jgi:hypothetical protein